MLCNWCCRFTNWLRSCEVKDLLCLIVFLFFLVADGCHVLDAVVSCSGHFSCRSQIDLMLDVGLSDRWSCCCL